jgi:hypothetical protein
VSPRRAWWPIIKRAAEIVEETLAAEGIRLTLQGCTTGSSARC